MIGTQEQETTVRFEPAPRPADRLFFAVYPPPDVAARIAHLAKGLRDELGLEGKLLASERLHVTLHHLGDHAGVPTDIVAKASQAAASLAMPAFELSFDRVASFDGRPRNRPFVMRAGEGETALLGFQQALGAAMTKFGLGRHVEGRFTPHVTMMYDDRLVQERAVEPIGWTASEFVLVHSLIGLGKHIPLARWALGR